MNAQTFLNNLKLVLNSPGGIRQIREMVLQLAVTARLSEQHACDTPGEVGYERCRIQSDRLIGDGVIRAQSLVAPVDDQSAPWPVPSTWKWCRLGEVTSYGFTEKADFIDVEPGTWVLELEDIEKETSTVVSKIRAKTRRFRSSKNRFSKGDVLYGKLRPYLDKVVVADEDGVCTTEIMPIRPFDGVDAFFLRLFLKSSYFRSYANNSTHGMNLPRLGTHSARMAFFPLPPLEEQKRIVAKVDELMRLCDRLEAQQQEREKLLPLLSRANHARFVASPAGANLRAIFHEPGYISAEDLLCTILTLAISGMLVKGNWKSECADSYLTGKSKLTRMPSRSLPKKWAWVRVDEVGEVQLGRQRAPEYHKGPNMRPYLRVQNVYEGRLDLTDVKSMEFGPKDYATFCLRPGDILLNEGQSRELVGRPALYAGEIENACFQNTLIRFRHGEYVLPEYALIVFRAYMHNGRFQEIAKQTTNIAHLGAGRFSALEFPLPPINEQRQIVARSAQLMGIMEQLEQQQSKLKEIASHFAKAAVVAITATEFTEIEKMKPPRTEVVTALKVDRRPTKPDTAPLAALLSTQKGETSAKTLWQLSGLEIDAFYRQLKTEIDNGWITKPETAFVREIEAN